jgi:hypothetical protein
MNASHDQLAEILRRDGSAIVPLRKGVADPGNLYRCAMRSRGLKVTIRKISNTHCRIRVLVVKDYDPQTNKPLFYDDCLPVYELDDPITEAIEQLGAVPAEDRGIHLDQRTLRVDVPKMLRVLPDQCCDQLEICFPMTPALEQDVKRVVRPGGNITEIPLPRDAPDRDPPKRGRTPRIPEGTKSKGV